MEEVRMRDRSNLVCCRVAIAKPQEEAGGVNPSSNPWRNGLPKLTPPSPRRFKNLPDPLRKDPNPRR
jgi:hypothetical protein